MTGFSVLSAGFRPFFWLAAVNAAASIATWLAFLSGVAIGTQGWPPQTLHAHEMIHGTVVAAIAGFLLTAVPSWSGSVRLQGTPMAALVALWAIGRLALAAGDVVPRPLVALLDCAFLPVLAVVLAVPIVRSRKLRNLSVIAVLVALALANVAMHAGLAQAEPELLRRGVYGSVYLVVLLMLIIGGRVIPLFTRNALQQEVKSHPWIGAGAIAAAALALGLDLVLPGGRAGGALALLAAALILARQLRWKPSLTLGRPILWILHLGHGWIAVGFACHALALLTPGLPPTAALHAFTAGAMGSLILGMMTRVSLGHTGRAIEASRFTVAAYVAVLVGALARVLGPVLAAPSQSLAVMLLSGCAFGAGYGIFAIEFAPILWRPRVAEAAPVSTAP